MKERRPSLENSLPIESLGDAFSSGCPHQMPRAVHWAGPPPLEDASPAPCSLLASSASSFLWLPLEEGVGRAGLAAERNGVSGLWSQPTSPHTKAEEEEQVPP